MVGFGPVPTSPETARLVRPWNDASFGVLDEVGFERTDRITVDDLGPSVWCRYGF